MPSLKVPSRAHFERLDPRTYRHVGLDAYALRLVQIRRSYVLALGSNGLMIDLACGPGEYLRYARSAGIKAIGVDFSRRVLLAEAAHAGAPLVQGDIRRVPLASECADLAICYTTLYNVPDVDQAVSEIGRILRRGGHAVLELGNRRSLNAVVMRDFPIESSLLDQQRMLELLSAAHLRIQERRCFQLLPMWGGRLWLRPLVTPKWRHVMALVIRGRMIDEWISSAVPNFAFRHLFVCEKV